MSLSSLSVSLSRLLFLPTVLSLLWLYLYPPIHGCAFPDAVANHTAAGSLPSIAQSVEKTALAPFRLLVLADPQLEGDTSLPDPNAPLLPSLERLTTDTKEHGLHGASLGVGTALTALITEDVPRVLQGLRKRLDLLGNDYYLAQIYRSVHWWTEPTHTVVLGDLLGSQWIGQQEFERRAQRFWGRVFARGALVPESIMAETGRVEELGRDKNWSRRVITVAGNHDIGYAGDIDSDRIERFERHFGRVNWELRFRLADKSKLGGASDTSGIDAILPELRLVVLNSMNLDEPTSQPDLREQTWQFLEQSFANIKSAANSSAATILLTHVPLHKEAGVCVDDPLINFLPPEYGGGIREQNHLRPETSQHILDGLLTPSIILNGHDHEGCDVWHLKQGGTSYEADHEVDHEADSAIVRQHWTTAKSGSPGSIDLRASIREITVRSMMGSYHGNAGFLSAWFDPSHQRWRFEYGSCRLGVQHFWWAVHVLALIEAGLLATATAAAILHRSPQTRLKTKSE